MLHEFLTTNRAELVERTRAKVAGRMAPRATEDELETGVPLFLNQLVQTLRLSRCSDEEIQKSAGVHAIALFKRGFTVAQVVHDYGDLCQAITELAQETAEPITVDEFHTLNRTLDEAIAGAVTEFTLERDRSIAAEGTLRHGSFAHELRNKLSVAMLSFDLLKSGNVGVGGSTGSVLGRSLETLRDLIDRSLTQVRLDAGIHERRRLSMAQFLEEIELSASMHANHRGIALTVTAVERGVYIEADPQLLASAVSNLLQNAFKFTHPKGHVALKTTVTARRVVLDIEDECGGLAPGKAEELFLPFSQRNENRTGLGLGLAISKQGVEANGGVLRVRDVPGKGCVFTIDLPRWVQPPIAARS